jgi:tetratricopeptide (TPR) repeat protein
MLHDVIDALRRNAPEAVALARAEAAAAPESADAQHLLGLAQRDAGDREAARASFDRAIDLAPDESLYHFSRALLAYAMGDQAIANQASARALALDPNQLGAYLLRIQLAITSGDHVEAERQLLLAERVDPDQPRLLFAAGQVALAKGDGAHAIELLNAAAAALPNDVQVLTTLGMAYQRYGHAAFAEQTLRKALKIQSSAGQPDSAGLHRMLIESLIGQDRIDDAVAELAIYNQRHPQDPAGDAIDADLQLRTGNPAGALAAFRAVLAQAPRNLGALMGVQRALEMLGDRELSRTVWEEALQRDPGFDPVWASRLTVADDEDDSLDVLRRWRAALPDSAAALLNQARQDEVDGRAAEAEAGYDAVLARAPLQYDAQFGKAAFELRRDPAAGIARLNVLIAHTPPLQAKSALAWRGLAHDGLQQMHDAVTDWQQAHAGLGVLPIMQPLPTDALRALAAAAPAPAATGENPLVMLWGPPGSGSERLVSVLRFSPSRPLLQATPEPLPRVLDFPEELIASAMDAGQLPALASELAAEYARNFEPYLQQGNQGVFDWLAWWDARVVLALRHALPATRLLVALRDPRDLLLNWLAFGAPAGPVFADPVASATWLASQLEHLLFSRDVLQLPVQIVDMDRFDADPAAGMQAIAAFADLPTAPDSQPALQRRTGPGGLPTLLPSGRWRAYRDELADAFAMLTPVAERLGYARE